MAWLLPGPPLNAVQPVSGGSGCGNAASAVATIVDAFCVQVVDLRDQACVQFGTGTRAIGARGERVTVALGRAEPEGK